MLTNNPNDDLDDKIKRKYFPICESLGIEKDDANTSWINYKKAGNDHSLEVSGGVVAAGPPLH